MIRAVYSRNSWQESRHSSRGSVLDGVSIGQGSVIGAGAVVTKNIPPFSVAIDIPAQVIKSRICQDLVL
jgi:acetyltransferase-like isoleucine patch superfamily enzyme